MFSLSRARLASYRLLMHRRGNLAKLVVPTLLRRGSPLAFHATMCRSEVDLEACWNRFLMIFAPYTFSHSQGHERSRNYHGIDVPRGSVDPYKADLLGRLLHRSYGTNRAERCSVGASRNELFD